MTPIIRSICTLRQHCRCSFAAAMRHQPLVTQIILLTSDLPRLRTHVSRSPRSHATTSEAYFRRAVPETVPRTNCQRDACATKLPVLSPQLHNCVFAQQFRTWHRDSHKGRCAKCALDHSCTHPGGTPNVCLGHSTRAIPLEGRGGQALRKVHPYDPSIQAIHLFS